MLYLCTRVPGLEHELSFTVIRDESVNIPMHDEKEDQKMNKGSTRDPASVSSSTRNITAA